MSLQIILSVMSGIGLGYFVLAESFIHYTDFIIDIGLCLLLFFVGIDIGQNRSVLGQIKRLGLKILFIPIMIIIGSVGGAILAGFLLGIPINESGAVGAGLGWYSLSSMILTSYSTRLSALAFITNVTREIIALMIIPLVAKYIGDFESIAPAGATAMDTTLPVISNSTNPKTAVVSFITGVILSSAVPVLVSFLIKL